MKNLVVRISKTQITLNDTVYLVLFNLIYGPIHGSVDITHESWYSIKKYEVKILRYLPSCVDEVSASIHLYQRWVPYENTLIMKYQNLSYLIMLLNSISLPQYLYLRSSMCALHINIRYLHSPLSDHRVVVDELCSYSHIIRQLEKGYNDRLWRSKSIWKYQLVKSVLQMPNDKTA